MINSNGFKYEVNKKMFKTLMGATDYSNQCGKKIITLTHHKALYK